MVSKAVKFLASLLIVLSIPVFLLASNARLLAVSPAYFDSGHDKYQVAQAMGVNQTEVRAVARAVIDYLQDGPTTLASHMTQHGVSPDFFSPRDHIHMVDVHELVQMVFQAQVVSGLVVGACLLLLVALIRRGRDEAAVKRVFWGAGFTLALLILISLVSFTNFDAVFLQFHYMAFSNDFWILDPNVDRLIVMFPPAFFYDMMLWAAILSFVEAAIVAILAGIFLMIKRRNQRAFLNAPGGRY